MTGEMFIVLAVLAAAVVLWVTEWWPVDLVAVCIPVALVAGGVLTPSEATAGFASPALLTVAAILIVSGGLTRTGVITWVGTRLIEYSHGDEKRLLLIVMLTMVLFSGFINNTAIVAMFLPLMLGLAQRFKVSPSKLLIPLSYASILGGTTTLIGTSTNIVVHGLMEKQGMTGIGMFEITPMGAIYALIGVTYLYFIGRKLLPDRATVTSQLQGSRASGEYMTEVQVPAGSDLIGRPVGEALQAAHPEVRLLQIIRGEALFWPPLDQVQIQAGDIFLLKGDVNQLLALYRKEGLELLPGLKAEAIRYAVKDMALAEVVIMPNSPLIGRTLRDVQFRVHYGASVLALQRHGDHLRDELPGIRLRVGDVLLVMADREDIDRLMTYEEFLVLEGVQEVVVRQDKAPISLGIVVALVALASLTSMPIMTLALLAAVLMVVTGCQTMRQAYGSLDLSVLILIGGSIALGDAMEKTGTASYLANGLVEAVGPYGPHMVLAAVYLATSVFTELMSNTAAAVLMTPIALGVAAGIGADPRPFAIAVAFAASAAFSTPIGYQTNTLVYGPGGYRFLDYTRVGLPLNLVLWIAASILIPLWWPLATP